MLNEQEITLLKEIIRIELAALEENIKELPLQDDIEAEEKDIYRAGFIDLYSTFNYVYSNPKENFWELPLINIGIIRHILLNHKEFELNLNNENQKLWLKLNVIQQAINNKSLN